MMRPMNKEEVKEILIRAHNEVMNDPKVKERAEEFVRKYGTLTAEDLNRVFYHGS